MVTIRYYKPGTSEQIPPEPGKPNPQVLNQEGLPQSWKVLKFTGSRPVAWKCWSYAWVGKIRRTVFPVVEDPPGSGEFVLGDIGPDGLQPETPGGSLELTIEHVNEPTGIGDPNAPTYATVRVLGPAFGGTIYEVKKAGMKPLRAVAAVFLNPTQVKVWPDDPGFTDCFVDHPTILMVRTNARTLVLVASPTLFWHGAVHKFHRLYKDGNPAMVTPRWGDIRLDAVVIPADTNPIVDIEYREGAPTNVEVGRDRIPEVPISVAALSGRGIERKGVGVATTQGSRDIRQWVVDPSPLDWARNSSDPVAQALSAVGKMTAGQLATLRKQIAAMPRTDRVVAALEILDAAMRYKR